MLSLSAVRVLGATMWRILETTNTLLDRGVLKPTNRALASPHGRIVGAALGTARGVLEVAVGAIASLLFKIIPADLVVAGPLASGVDWGLRS